MCVCKVNSKTTTTTANVMKIGEELKEGVSQGELPSYCKQAR